MISEQKDAEFHKVANEIAKNNPYQRKESEERTMMTVHEMGDLLGIKKTDRYWLLHKGFFKTKVVLGKTWVDIASFEKWYDNQVKYKKVNGEEPGKELKAWSYSPQELAQELGVTDSVLYDILKRENIQTVTVDYWKRIPKEAFDKWYVSQSRYRTRADREKDLAAEAATITMPEMARLLGTTRNTVYSILNNPNYKEFFNFVVIADKKRITIFLFLPNHSY